MKIQILTDNSGNIVATAPMKKAVGASGPAQSSMVQGRNQKLHEVDVQNAIGKLAADDLHKRFRVSLSGKARLIETADQKTAKKRPKSNAQKKKHSK